MERLKKCLGGLVIGMTISACATHSGYYDNSCSLDKGDFCYVKTVEGTAKTGRWFSRGGFGQEKLTAAAREDMESKYTLKPHEEYTNIRVDYKWTKMFLHDEVRVVMKADVVEFTEEGE